MRLNLELLQFDFISCEFNYPWKIWCSNLLHVRAALAVDNGNKVKSASEIKGPVKIGDQISSDFVARSGRICSESGHFI